MHKVPTPLNTMENLLYGINNRLEILIQQMSSFLEVYAERNQLAVEETVQVEEKPKRKKK
jgi:hypothetical protein